MRHHTRRAALGLAAAGTAGLSGCASLPDLPIFGTLTAGWSRQGEGAIETPDYAVIYAALPGEKHRVPAFDYTNLDPLYLRADIPYAGMEGTGTIVVDARRRLLYHVVAQGRARRYGIAIGPESRGFSGLAVVASKRIWPDFSPGSLVAARANIGWAQLGTPAVASPARPRIPGGPRSPLGARGLYLAANGAETGYVIHGTPDPMAVGADARGGCIALIDQDVVDLYERAPEGTRVVVLG